MYRHVIYCIFFPVKLCHIAEGQEYRRKLSDIQTTNMIRNAATPANVRKQKILEAVSGMNFGADKYCRNFEISVDTKMVQVDGIPR